MISRPRRHGAMLPRGSRTSALLVAALTTIPAAAQTADAAEVQRSAVGLPLEQRSLGSFAPLVLHPGAQVDLLRGNGRPLLRMADRPGVGGYVTLSTPLSPRTAVRNRAVVNVARQRLARGRARAILWTNGARGHAYRAGVIRTRTGALRWALWRSTPRRKVVDVIVTGRRAELGSWTKVDLLSRWGTPDSRATLRIDGEPVARSRPRDLSAVLATRVNLGFARPAAEHETGLMLVRAARVDTGLEVAAPAAPPAPPPPPPVATAPGREIDRADYETGDLSQWAGRQAVSSESIRIVSDPVRQGARAARFEVKNGDNPIGYGDRAEVQLSVNEREGDERWYSWSTMFDPSYPSLSTWQVVSQWHCTCDGPPSLGFYVSGERLQLALNESSQKVLWSTPLERGRWHDLMLHVKWSGDASVGYVELWHNGVKAVGPIAARTLYPGESAYFKQGLYRQSGSSPTGVVYHDGFRVTAP